MKPLNRRKARLAHSQMHDSWKDDKCPGCLKTGGSALMEDAHGLSWRVTCPHCAREWVHTYPNEDALPE